MFQRSAEPGATSDAAEPFLDAVGRLAPAIEAAAAGIDRDRRLPKPLVDRLIEAKLYRMLLPRDCGGAALDPAGYLRVIEAVAKLDGSVAWCLGQACGSSVIAAYLAPDAARALFGDARAILAWGPGVGRAIPVEGGYRVSGRWSFASGGHEASLLGGHSVVVNADGTARPDAAGAPVVRTMLFPAEAARWSDTWQVMGLRGTASDSYEVEGLFVPKAHSVSREPFVERRDPAPLYGLTQVNLYATAFAGVALGLARRMLDEFIRLAQEKQPRDQRRLLRDSAVVQARVAEAEAILGSARSYLMDAYREIWPTLAPGGQASVDQRMRIRLATTFAIHRAVAVADQIFHAAGATAIFAGNPFERRFRDIHSVAQQVQGRAEHFETVGQHLLGLEADNPMI